MKMDIENFNKNRGIYSPVVEEEGIITHLENGTVFGVWMMGNNYHNKISYYGTYPPSYLKRMRLLFPDTNEHTVHLFSGMVERGLWNSEITVDIKPDLKPDVCCDAETLSKYINPEIATLILADPPYGDNHLKYGTPKVNKRQVIKECIKVLKPGGYLVWLDSMIPMWAKADGWKWIGVIAVVQSTQHQIRAATILQKVRP